MWFMLNRWWTEIVRHPFSADHRYEISLVLKLKFAIGKNIASCVHFIVLITEITNIPARFAFRT